MSAPQLIRNAGNRVNHYEAKGSPPRTLCGIRVTNEVDADLSLPLCSKCEGRYVPRHGGGGYG